MKTVLRSNEKAVYRMLNAGVLAGAVLLGGQRYLGTGELGVGHMFTALIVLAVSSGLNFMAARGRNLCLAGLSVLFVTGVSVAGAEDSIAFIGGFFPWLIGRGAASEAWSLGYGLVQTGFLTGMCYLVQMLFEKLQTLKMAAGILAFLVMLACLFTQRELDHYGVAFLVVFCVTVWMEWVQGRWKKVRSQGSSREAHTLWVMPFLALYFVLLTVMPAPEEPYGWQWAVNLYGRLQETVLTFTRNIKWGSREGFDMAFSGFSEDGELKGEVRKDASPIMRIQVSRNAFGNAGGNIYLTGGVYDTFDGRGWHQDWQGHPGEVFLDTAETLYAVRNYNEEYQKDYLREASLEIRYEDFNTEHVFAPLKTWSVEGVEENDYASADGSLCWTKQKGYGTEYVLRFFRMNAGQREFDRFIEAAGNNGGRGIGEEIQDDILPYRKEIWENYLKEARLSQEVSDYLEEITRDAATDVEKLRAIESKLRSFTYTLSPGELPSRVKEAGDFMDYFFLESRQGYCTYFATAFVLLARAEGIPARYVQGYCVPVPEGGEAYVDSSMAHAWPEAYLEGVGWIPFEPTPGYGDRRYSPWKLAQLEQDGLLVSDDKTGGMAQEAGSDRKAGDDSGEDSEGSPEEVLEEGDKAALSYLWRLFGIGIPALLTVCAAVLAMDYAMNQYRYKKMNLDEKFRIEVFRNLTILSWLGVRKKEWETLQELRERAGMLTGLEGERTERFTPEARGAGSLYFIEDYEKVVYGGAEVREDMLEEAVQDRETLLQLLKEEKKWNYFCCRMGLYFGNFSSWRMSKGI